MEIATGLPEPSVSVFVLKSGSLVRHSLGEIGKVRRVVGAKNAAELSSDRQKVVVVPQIGQELLRRRVRRNIREYHVLNGRESIPRLHHMCNPAAARKLLVKGANRAIVGHRERDVGAFLI